ncbi:hypothetical protein [Sporolactobacillus terrae]|uniref:Uncharacterized protein n=1 Tax=Sporolactobacillus terrae TaxID=269673 RepID=A0A410DCQ4_9BACL|nr:hypothetical protein [Sporolactobacillus terrae]QAA23848.1 hypothetical protein C0674_15315 [Sporolactobacillus terrae]QAA26819.1 hypothetical protein C0679_15300 [Sporolactobacillus terrae]UAK15882.1 hypothetical protein K7399_12840 [Sporolactobacillus terrae]BBO00386.1 hypothetical protein St703_30900 [Sporolactobacillus terrae]
MEWRSFQGIVTAIDDYITSPSGENSGCWKLMTLENNDQVVRFVVSPITYVVDQAKIRIGDRVSGYYDGNAPVILIYPPQYRALILVKERSDQNVKVGFFNEQLLSRDGQLQLNLGPFTQVMLANGQDFNPNPANRDLIVIYGAATKSIPAQTVPYKIIVWCPMP